MPPTQPIDSPFFRSMLIELATTRMPFGRYKGRLLVDLPEPYLVWFRQRGFPDGKLGMQLASLYEIKVNGLEYLLRGILKRTPGHEETPSND